MTSTVRRAGAFALVGTLALAAPLLEVAAVVSFGAVAALATFVVDDGPLFELFARPGDWEERRLYGLSAFALAAAGLALLAAFASLPTTLFVASVLLLAYGNLVAEVVRVRTEDLALAALAFVVGGAAAGTASVVLASLVAGGGVPSLANAVFLTVSGGLLGAILRTALFRRDDAVVLPSIGLTLWLLDALTTSVSAPEVGIALAVTAALGYVSYALETASVPGMVAGVFLALLTIVLGGYGWFAVLIAFFAIGGLSTKFRYDEKLQRGVAEENEGARGSGNVLANAAVSLVAVVAYAATPLSVGPLAVSGTLFLYVFTGSVATAMSDTLSSEIGGVFDRPRLITTLRPVEPGTDGGVTWQGEVAGITGAAVVAGIALVMLDVGATGFGIVAFAGFAGMTADSLLGATVEGGTIGNSTVNFLATLVGGVVAGLLALGVGVA